MNRASAAHKMNQREWRAISTQFLVTAIVAATAAAIIGSLWLWRDKHDSQSQSRVETAPSLPTPFKVTVKLRETLNVGNDLSITLTDIQQDLETKKLKVWAKVVIKGQSDMQIRRAEEGYAVTYPEEHGYTIELLKAVIDSAKFSITKNP